MGKVKTFVNGGTLLPGDLNSIEEDYEWAFGSKKHLLSASTRLDAPTAATYLLGAGTSGAGVIASAATAGLSPFYLAPLDYEGSAVNKRTVKLDVQATVITNAVAPGITFTVGLYPVTAAAAGGEATVSVTLGSVIAGSTVAFATPAKEVLAEAVSSAFVCPAAGYYALCVVASGSAAAKSSAAIRASLQMAQI
jgi:hypothetical protein